MTDINKQRVDKAKAEILKLIPKKKELDDCGVVKEVCYGYNQAQKGFNACRKELLANLNRGKE